MVNSVSTVRNNRISTRRFDRPKTPPSVLTDAAKTHQPMLGNQLFRQTGDESRERFFSVLENTVGADADGDTQSAQNPPAALNQSLQARFAQAAGNPKQFKTLLKQALGENYSSDSAETIRQQTLDGDFSWMPMLDQDGTFTQLLSDENIDSQQSIDAQIEADNDSINVDGTDAGAELSMLGKPTDEAKKLIGKLGRALGRTIDENLAQPIKRQAVLAGVWVNDNLAQPVQRQTQRTGRWVNENVAQPIRQQTERTGAWVSDEVAQPVKRQAQRFGSWVGESIIQPAKSGSLKLAGWTGDKVLQPSMDTGKAVLRGAASVVDITVARPIQQGAELIGEYARNTQQVAQNVWSDAQTTFKVTFTNAAAPGSLESEADAVLAETKA